MKHIILSLGLMAAAAMGAQAAEVKSVDELSNDKAYVITRMLTGGNGTVYFSDDAKLLASSKADKTADNSLWAIHYSEAEKGYFLYNLGQQKFIGAKKGLGVASDVAADVIPTWLETARYWILDCGGLMLGLDEEGIAIFTDDIDRTGARTLGYTFKIEDSSSRTISAEENVAIETKIAEGRVAKIAEYQDFVDKAEKLAEKKAQASFDGDYDVTELKAMLADPTKYSLAQFQQAYNAALKTGYPSNKKFYRIRNAYRPTTTAASNLVMLNEDCNTFCSATLKNPQFGNATSGRAEDLSIFRLYAQNGDPTQVKVYVSAVNGFLGPCGNGNAWVNATSDGAGVFTLERVSTTGNKQFRFAQPAKSNWLTVSGDNRLCGYGTQENAMNFYFEPVTSIAITLDANGYASFVLPCGYVIPDGVKAYTVTSVADGKAYVEELASPVHYGTPSILKGEANAKVELVPDPTTAWVASAMTGTMVAKSDAPARHVLVSDANGFKFSPVEAGKAKPGDAYIISDHAGDLTVVMGANPDASIEDITLDDASAMKLYNIQGIPVKADKLRPGLYINATSKKVIRVN